MSQEKDKKIPGILELQREESKISEKSRKIPKNSVRYSEKGESFVELNVRRLEEKPKRSSVYEKQSLPNKPGSYAYVNMGYDGSMGNRSGTSNINYIQPTSTSVVREQYWACSKWPKAQRVLAITVGILLGAVIGLAVTMSLKIPQEDTIIGSLITRNTG